MQISISNVIRIRGAIVPVKILIKDALTEPNPEWVKKNKRKQPTWNMRKTIEHYAQDMGDLIVPRGFEDELLKLIAKYPYEIDRRQTEGVSVDFGPWNSEIQPRSYQQDAIDACQLNNGVLVAPAGGGKTLMGCHLIHDIGRPTIWLTHTKDLMYQSKANAEKYLTGVGRVGVIGDGVFDYGDGNLIIATLQTLGSKPGIIERLNDFIGLVVVDECHHLPASMFIEIISQWRAKRIIGLTATPDRKDELEKIMYLGVGPKLHEIDRQVLYDNGFLVMPKLKFIYTEFDYEQASDRQGTTVDAGGEDLDYIHLIKTLTNDEDRLDLLARTIIENYDTYDIVNTNYALVLSENTRYCFKIRDRIIMLWDKYCKRDGHGAPMHSLPVMAVVHGGLMRNAWRVCKGERLAKKMVEKGIAIEYRPKKTGKGFEVKVAQYNDVEYDAWQVSKKKRREIIASAERKEVQILFATQLAREGLDLPHLNQLHEATPKKGDASGSKNGAALEQEVGRVQRRDPSNPAKEATVFDYVDYGVGVFKNQYGSRRSVYKRLGMKIPNKPKSESKKAEELLSRIPQLPSW